jgi:hypothetical protein
MKNEVFWDFTPCGCKNRRFAGTYHLHHYRANNRRAWNNVSSNLNKYVSDVTGCRTVWAGHCLLVSASFHDVNQLQVSFVVNCTERMVFNI